MVRYVARRYPSSTLFAAGWSLGANILVSGWTTLTVRSWGPSALPRRQRPCVTGNQDRCHAWPLRWV